MTPGNEVAVVQNGQVLQRVKVGVRPQRIAIHPAGLVFVCNQYSNFISIIDPNTNQLLAKAGKVIEVPTEYYCSDLAFVPLNPRSQNPDQQYLYVANRWRHSVLKIQVDAVRDPLTNRAVDVVVKPATEILGVGRNPFRLTVSEQRDAVYVANNKGGEIARLSVAANVVTSKVAANGPSADIVNVADVLYVPTTMVDRGLLAASDQKPQQVLAPPVRVTGMDKQSHIAHPGAMFDNTRSYNFEDVRNGLLQLDFQLVDPQTTYFTDDNSGEPNFVDQQKILAGALPTTVVRNQAGTSIFLALGGSDVVQELRVNLGARPFTLTAGRTFNPGRRPFGLALDEVNNRLFVTTWAGEQLEVYDLASGNRLSRTDLGYAVPEYPATNVERGELFFLDARWSNNRRKACASCHFDELDTDGVGFSNGVTAPTAYHQVKPNHNLLTTDSYFWNGSFRDGSYASVAFAAQTRTNCEVIQLGLVEGPASNPATRVGDPGNRFRNDNDDNCRPQSAGPGQLANQAQINQVIAAAKQDAAQEIENDTGLSPELLSRVIDAYSVAELRLPPNPLAQLKKLKQLDPALSADLDAGANLFLRSGCATCHDPNNARHPFTDGLNHGGGADWLQRFIDIYANDARVTQAIGALPQKLLDGLSASVPDHEVNIHLDPIDYFVPFCFDLGNCLQFDDPLAVRGSAAEETRRLGILVDINLADPARQFIPGNVRGAPAINTPSLRGVWTQANLLRHGLAHTVAEAILAPGHTALGAGELGYAVDALGKIDVHGETSKLTADEVRQLLRYVESIE
jgi:YVTN family beta-propeller protein